MKGKKIKVILAIFLLLSCICLILISRHPKAKVLFLSKKHFLVHETDSRVLYEPGAEQYAAQIAAIIDSAITIIESEQGLPFKESFSVYMCKSQASFNRYVGDPPNFLSRGAALLGNVYIPPRAFFFEQQDTHRETLIHELSHLHLAQMLGRWQLIRRIPVWFREGLANTVANSSGEAISEKESIRAILAGHHFVPDDKGSFLIPKHAGDYGLRWQMFHIQNKMFVKFIKQKYPNNIKKFLLSLYNGDSFASAFSNNFGCNVDGLWEQFFEEISTR